MNGAVGSVSVRFALILSLISFAAADSWSRKPCGEWTKDECEKLLSDSPWSRRAFGVSNAAAVSIEPGKTRVPQGGGAIGPPCSACGQRSGSMPEGAVNSPGSQPDRSAPTSANLRLNYQVLWFSSVHLRQAMYRMSALHGEPPDPRMEASLRLPAAEILIAVSSTSMERFRGAVLTTLKETTFLRSKKKQSKRLELLDFISPAAREDKLAIFVFARELEGRPAFD